MLTISSLTPRSVIHCPTVDQYMDIRTLMLAANCARIPEPETWTHAKGETCIMADGNTGYLGYFTRQAYTVLQAADFLPVSPATEYEAYALPEAPSAKKSWMRLFVENLIVFANRKRLL